MLKVNSSSRIQRRYILIEGTNFKKLEEVLEKSLGSIGLGKTAIIVVSESPLIIGVRRESVDDIRAAVELSPEEVNIKRVSGTLKGLHRNL